METYFTVNHSKVLEEGLKVTGSFTFGSWSEKTLKSYHIDVVSQLYNL